MPASPRHRSASPTASAASALIHKQVIEADLPDDWTQQTAVVVAENQGEHLSCVTRRATGRWASANVSLYVTASVAMLCSSNVEAREPAPTLQRDRWSDCPETVPCAPQPGVRWFDVGMGLAKRWAEEISARGFDDTGNQTVCMTCVLDDDLRAEAGKHLSEWECTFCGDTADEDDDPIAAPFDDFMTIIMDALHFVYRDPEGSLAWDSEEGEWVGGQVISSTEAAYDFCRYDVTDKVMESIAGAIREEDWTDEDIAQLSPDEALRFSWEAFHDKVKYSSRFVFLSTPEEHSDHPDEFTTEEFLQKVDAVLLNHGTLLPVAAGRKFWRGRLTGDPANARVWNKASELGPPPREFASNSRMSPAGITMFYGSNDIATAVAEIGAHSSQRHAILGQFETIRDLILLNLADLPPVPSLYTEAGRTPERYDLVFLHRFATDLGKPIALDGREHIEYVPTQVVTEYLRFVSKNAADGILYRSAQNQGVCCVLFCDSSNCIDLGQTPDCFSEPWLQLHPDSVHSLQIIAAAFSVEEASTAAHTDNA